MDRAGRAVARAAIDLLGARYGSRVAVVCGKGNNGGDGLVAARLLMREGVDVRCFLVCSREEVQGAAAKHLQWSEAAGVRVEPFGRARLGSFAPDLVVDAIFGTGFSGRAEGAAGEAIEAICDASLVVAVDIPSGVDGSTGACDGPCVSADVTVAIAAEKWGTSQPPGSIHAGSVHVVDIGIPIPPDAAEVWMVDGDDVARMLPGRKPDAHKRSAGAVVILAGSDPMPGAAALAGVGALRMGAGYVSLGTTGEAVRVVTELVPEILCTRLTSDAQLDAGSLTDLIDALDRADAVAAGPGLGRGEEISALVRELLSTVEAPLVLDADALNALEGDLSFVSQRSEPTILTPHAGEMARLLGCTNSEVVHDRLGAARAAASQSGNAVVLLKGQRTIVATARASYVVGSGGPELATAGTGDVLTGAITALCAAGVPPVEAAIAGAHVHGIAGALAGQRLGTSAVMARDVADGLGRAAGLIRESRFGPDLL